MATATHPLEVDGAIRRARPAPAPSREERLAPLSGVAVLLLGLAGLIVLEGPADRPEWDAPRRLFLTYFGEHRNSVVLGGFLMMLAAVFFLWFASSLRAVLRGAEGGVGRLSSLAYGGAVITAAFMLALPGSNVLGAVYATHLSPEGAQLFFLFGNVVLYPAAVAGAVLIAATALIVLRTGVLTRWLAWPSLVLALWLLIPPLGSAAGTPENPAAWTGFAVLPGIPIWTAVIGVMLLLKYRKSS